MPADKTNARSRRTRAALLSAVRAILEDDGFEGLSMEAVAAHANVTRRTIYLHFETRAQLLASVFDYVAEQEHLHASLDQVWKSENSLQALRNWARHITRYYPRVLRMERAITRARYHGDDAAEAYWNRIMQAQRANTARLALWLKKEGHLAKSWTVTTAADMIWALTNSAIVERLLVDRHWNTRRFEVLFGDVLCNSLTR